MRKAAAVVGLAVLIIAERCMYFWAKPLARQELFDASAPLHIAVSNLHGLILVGAAAFVATLAMWLPERWLRSSSVPSSRCSAPVTSSCRCCCCIY